MPKKKCVFNWSGGKDSSIALRKVLQNPEYSVDCLLTTINGVHDRITMHGVRRELLLDQVKQIGIPLEILELPEQPDMEEYNRCLSEKMEKLKREGYTHSLFGDIFLEDLKEYRERQMQRCGFESVFPIWKEDTSVLIRDFIEDGFKAVIVSAKSEKLDQSFAGRLIDHEFLDDLPDGVDPCGENGEFHTFVYDGPVFSNPVPFKKGELTYREYDAPKDNESSDGHSTETDPKKMGFWFCDLLIHS